MIDESIEINEWCYPVNIFFEKRKNCRVSIGKKAINIRIPSYLSQQEKLQEITRMKVWAEKKIRDKPEKFKPPKQKEYKNGDIITIGDEQFSLRLSFKEKKTSSAVLQGTTITLSISNTISKEKQNNHISSLISRCVGSKRLPILKHKIQELNSKYFNQHITNIYFKHNKTNWGSCSRAGNINISTRLLFAPDDVLEYVCIHELAHLLIPNHSKQFWSLVEQSMPNYKEKERWLKENSSRCTF